MTEPFSTSVAAVAPVLLLIGAVEMAAVSRREGSALDARSAALEECLRRIGEDGYVDPLRMRREVAGALAAHPPVGWRNIARVSLWGGWAVGAMLQLWAFVAAMRWLATPGAGPEPDMAWLCFHALTLGALWVVLVPMVLAIVELIRTDRREDRLTTQLQAWLDVTHELYETDAADRQSEEGN
jgi:hypothetical protein